MTDYAKLIHRFWPDWTVEEKLGSGSYGTVYRAKRVDLTGVTTYSAIKVIRIPKEEPDEDLEEDEETPERSASYLEGVVRYLAEEIRMMETVKGYTNIVSIEDHFIYQMPDEPVWVILIRMELLTSLRRYMAQKPLDEQGPLLRAGRLPEKQDHPQGHQAGQYLRQPERGF